MHLQTLFKKHARLALSKLTHPVTINIDEQAVPHIQAKTRHDLFFAQGVVHAQERLWQMELNRRVANGTLSELFGEQTVETDRLSRTMGFVRLAKSGWERLDEPFRSDIIAYCDGINAYLDSKPFRPLELLLLRHRPASWQPLDVMAYARLQAWALTSGASGELIRARLVELLGSEKAADLLPTIPQDTPVTLPTGIDLNPFSAADLPPFMGKGEDGTGRGSNGWVISGQHTNSGKPLLANDMHLPLRLPSLWFLVGLHSEDGIHAAGFSQPGLPYILVGGNQHLSWGATLAYTDCEDIVLEKFDPNDPTRYLTPEGWQTAVTHLETIKIKGQPDHIETVIVTRNGTILPQEKETGAPSEILPTLTSIALEPQTGLDGFGMLLTSENWAQFSAAVEQIEAPPLNLLYADKEGNIGYCLTGRIPIRNSGDGTLPVNGWETAVHWTGFVSQEEMPRTLNPASGIIISANNRIVDNEFPSFLGNIWRNGYRAQRIEQLLAAQPTHSATDFSRYQLDDRPVPGRPIAAAIQHFSFSHPLAVLAQTLLGEWNGRLSATTIGGTAYSVLLDQLSQHLLNPLLPQKLRLDLLGTGEYPNLEPLNDLHGYWSVNVLRWLNGELSWLHEDSSQVVVLEKALADTILFLQNRLGRDPQRWQWRKLHTQTFPHAFAQQPPLGFFFNAGPYPYSGDGDTVAQSSSTPTASLTASAIGVSSRHISDLDTGQLWAIHPPGQSGRRFSRFRTSLVSAWKNGRLLPLFPQPKPSRTLTLLPPNQ